MDAEQNKNVIEIERHFDVDVETLFGAWTEAEHLKKWWHPMGNSLTDVKNELKEGGAVEYHVGDAGLQITGSYTEVVPNEKLAYSWVWNMNDEGSESGYTLNITFSSDGEGSKLRVLQEGFSAPEFLKPHEEGWEKGLNDLSSYLASGSNENQNASGTSESGNQDATAQDNVKSAENMTDRSGGYNEAPEQVKVGGADAD